MRRTRGDYESVLSQKDDPESGEDGVESGRRKKTELAMKREVLKKLMKNLKQKSER
jgi:hypothetical protein